MVIQRDGSAGGEIADTRGVRPGSHPRIPDADQRSGGLRLRQCPLNDFVQGELHLGRKGLLSGGIRGGRRLLGAGGHGQDRRQVHERAKRG